MFEQIICLISSELQRRNISYMLIGGQAVLLYGEPRLTRDIDITIGVDVDRLDDVIAVTDALDLKILPQNIQDFVRKTMVLPAIHEETGIRVDFIFSFSPYERQAIACARSVRMGDQDICFAAPEDVVVHKMVAGRPRDMEDARGILLKNPGINKAYIRQWLADIAGGPEGEEIQSRFEDLLKNIT